MLIGGICVKKFLADDFLLNSKTAVALYEKYAKDILENKEYRSQIVQQSVDNKLYAEIKNAVKLDEISYDYIPSNSLYTEFLGKK